MTVSLSLSLSLKQAFKRGCLILLLTNSLTAFAQLKVNNIGYIGIGNNNPAYKLDVEGSFRYSAWTDVIMDWTGLASSPAIVPERDWYLQLGKQNRRLGNIFVCGIHTTSLWWDSDGDIKTNIQPINNPIEILQGMNGKTYNFTDGYLNNLPESEKLLYSQSQFGFIADEMNEILPNLVYTYSDSVITRSSINYVAIIPILVEAIKQQQNTISEMQNQLSACCGSQSGMVGQKKLDIVKDTKVLGGFVARPSGDTSNGAVLFQNNPNPYTEKTEIRFSIPQSSQVAFLIVYNLNGEQLKKYNIDSKGLQSIIINGNEFNAGSYYYTLIVDDKEVSTKKMILVK